jgi:hypothetical protein
MFTGCALASGPAHATETFFDFEIQAGGFYGIAGKTHAGGFVPGFTAGGLTWFGDDPIAGLRWVGNADIGVMITNPTPSSTKPFGMGMFSGSVGPAFLLSGDAAHPGGVISLGWSPRIMLNFSPKFVGSPAGVELEMGWKALKFPIWYLHTLGTDATHPAGDFVGFGIAIDIARLAR